MRTSLERPRTCAPGAFELVLTGFSSLVSGAPNIEGSEVPSIDLGATKLGLGVSELGLTGLPSLISRGPDDDWGVRALSFYGYVCPSVG